MSEHKPMPPGSSSREITFTPVPLRYRRDGWTVERQVAFLEKLADCGSMRAVCRHVGMSRESLRRLRRHVWGRDFRDACEAAIDCAYAELEEAAAERAKNGVPRPIFYKGEQVGEWRQFDERLTMFLLRFRRRHRFGPEADELPRPPSDIPGCDPDERRPFDPEGELGGCLEVLDFEPEPEAEAEPKGEDGSAWPQPGGDEE